MLKLKEIIRSLDFQPVKITSPCPHYPLCGGCQLIDVAYPQQLELKEQIIKKAKAQTCPQLPVTVQPVIPALDTTYYRNKMEFSFGCKDENIYLGLKKRADFACVIKTDHCLLQSQIANQILQWASKYFTASFQDSTSPLYPYQDQPVWDHLKHKGLLRYLGVRHSKTHDQFLINLVISKDERPLFQDFITKLTAQFSQIVSVYITVQDTISDTAFSENIEHVFGTKTISEDLNGYQFEISPLSFFQTNTTQAKVLYQKILELADIQPQDLVMDLYCGTGTIGIYVAAKARQVIGIEEVEQAVTNARLNAQHNQVTNIEFYLGRVKNILKFNKFEPNVVIVDPPRSGLVPKALQRTLSLQARKLVYVSCNPVTLFHDLQIICKSGYQIKHFQPVDMFPNTYHLESIVVLERN
ncbi:23S rRNA (uracil(1939)-C(5))-methyltransferase RlmD [bacterium]|nr:23S rRNA (uracil(1939)-C(5))-methyltransferase RlmD [bacterium]